MRADTVAELRAVADYQFGAGAGAALFRGDETVRRSRSGRPRQVLADGERLVSVGTDGRFTLGLAGGRRLLALDPPTARVTVGEESAPFVREGKNAFAKFVRDADPALRARDEVCVLADGDLVGVGRTELDAAAMADFETGVAVEIREGNG
jgi:uncharacterized protein with predicted RNA binding PUA domain